MQLGWPHTGWLQCGTLTHGALLQVAGLRGLILRSQLIVLLKHKVGDNAWRLGYVCCPSPVSGPLLPALLGRSWQRVPVISLSSPRGMVGAAIQWWGYPSIILHPTGLTDSE